MPRTGPFFETIEHALWRNRTAIFMLAAALTLGRLIWVYSAQPELAQYPVREMLVNSAGGFVRRGLSGDVILFLSNTFGGPPTAWATFSLTILGGALFAACIQLFRKLPNDPSLTPLYLAPWGLLFMAYDADVMIRKEAFGYLAMCLVLLGAHSTSHRNALIYFVISCLLMPTAILMHEINAALGIPVLIATWLLTKRHPQIARPIFWLGALATLASTTALIAALTHLTSSPAAMCAAFNDPLCEHPFAYFDHSMRQGFGFVTTQITGADIPIAALLMAAALLPFCGLRPTTIKPRSLIVVALIAALPVLPLFVIATDYGRWIVLIVFPASLLAATALSMGLLTYRRILPPWAVLLYCGTWSIYHYDVDPRVMGLLLWPALALALAIGWCTPRAKPQRAPP